MVAEFNADPLDCPGAKVVRGSCSQISGDLGNELGIREEALQVEVVVGSILDPGDWAAGS